MGSRRSTVLDCLLVLALSALSLTLLLGLVEGWGSRVSGAALVLGHQAPLLLRRHRPLPVLAAMLGTGALTVPLGIPVVALGPGILFAIYTVGSRCPPPTGQMATLAAVAGMALAVLHNGMDASTVVTNALAFAGAWWLGDRARRAELETVSQRALAAQAARRAAAEERIRIARELHDVVAHAMSVIAVQAGTGRFVIDESPEVARDALASIEVTSRAALHEMRRLLGILRDEDGEAGLEPAPGLGDIASLVEGSGMDVDLVVEGPPRLLPAGVDLCAYRIVQEALTNVRKHAGARRTSVTVRYTPAAVALEVVDDGCGPNASSTPGHGLIGMRERAELYGGTVDAGSAGTRGFRVHVVLPVSAPA